MFEKTIKEQLKKLFGDFIEDVDLNQINNSLIDDNLLLKNINIKASLFDSLSLPFTLKFGRIGTIRVNTPRKIFFNWKK